MVRDKQADECLLADGTDGVVSELTSRTEQLAVL